MSKKACGAAVQTAAVDVRGDEHAHNHALTINVVAKMFGVSTWTLRFYEWRGLIGRDNDGAFGWRDCERVALIVKAKKAGLTIRQITPVVEAMNSDASSESLKAGHQCCRELIARLRDYSDPVADVLAELDRIDWEFSARLATNMAAR
jgi:DNA-binding transcriptional MerR regulator